MSGIVLTSSLHRGAALGRGIMVGRGVGGGVTLVLDVTGSPSVGAAVTISGDPLNSYQWVVNGSPEGSNFASPSTLPAFILAGDEIQARDVDGNLSNIVVAVAPPDPLAAYSIPLRVQCHDNISRGLPRSYINIAGAGDPSVDGRYYQTGPFEFTQPTSGFVLTLSEAPQWHIYDATGTYHMYYSDGAPSRDITTISEVAFYAAIDGTDPGPAGTLGVENYLRPQWVYQDTACTIPAWLDGHIVQGFRHPKTNAIQATQTTSLGSFILRFDQASGKPFLEANNGRSKHAFVSDTSLLSDLDEAQIWAGVTSVTSASSTLFFQSHNTNQATTRNQLLINNSGALCQASIRRLDDTAISTAATVTVTGSGWRIFKLLAHFSAGNFRVGVNNTLGSLNTMPAGAGKSDARPSARIRIGAPSGASVFGGISSFFVMKSVPDSSGQAAFQTYLASLNP